LSLLNLNLIKKKKTCDGYPNLFEELIMVLMFSKKVEIFEDYINKVELTRFKNYVPVQRV
jgi:hypothetical protein